MKYYCFALLILICSCTAKNGKDGDKSSADAIPAVRDTINKKPVASYVVPAGDPRLNLKFGVEIFETKYTFKYLLVMQYEGMEQTDTLKVPNFDVWPIVQVTPGKEKLSCIIGFLDKEKNFRQYKLLSAKNDQLRLTVLQGYAVSEN